MNEFNTAYLLEKCSNNYFKLVLKIRFLMFYNYLLKKTVFECKCYTVIFFQFPIFYQCRSFIESSKELVYRKFYFFGILLLKNHYFYFSYNFHIFKRTTLKFFIQQENYQHSFKIAGFFDAIPVRPEISLGVGPPK
jgi:hypothetical protein